MSIKAVPQQLTRAGESCCACACSIHRPAKTVRRARQLPARRSGVDLSSRFGVEPGRTYGPFWTADGPALTRDFRAALRDEGIQAKSKGFIRQRRSAATCSKFYIYSHGPCAAGQEIFSQIGSWTRTATRFFRCWLTDELWDETGQSHTSTFIPGRIKCGVILRDVFGPVLLPQRIYPDRPRIDGDVNGQKLAKTVKEISHDSGDRVR